MNLYDLAEQLSLEVREKLDNPEPNSKTLEEIDSIVRGRHPSTKRRRELVKIIWRIMFGTDDIENSMLNKLFDR